MQPEVRIFLFGESVKNMVICNVQEARVFLGEYVPLKEESIMDDTLCSVIS